MSVRPRQSTRHRRRSRPARRLMSTVGVLAGVALLPTAPVAAVPIQPSGPASEDSAVRVAVTALAPRDLTSNNVDGELVVTGSLQNTSADDLGGLRLRAEVGPVIRTRGELHLVADPDGEDGEDTEGADEVTAACDWQELPAGLGAGQSAPFEYRCPIADLSAGSIGVYPLTIQVEAAGDEEDTIEVGRARTFLPSFPDGVSERTRVSWLWPLIDRPHWQPVSDVFVDDDLGASVADGGRLDRMLRIAEQATAAGVPLTLVVDPALVDELTRMEQGYAVRSQVGPVPGEYDSQAKAWLDRLAALAARQPVALVPYGDPDVVALNRGGLTDLATSRPVDRALVADRLRVDELAPIAWPPDGTVTTETLSQVSRGGITGVVLASEVLPGVPAEATTPTAVTPLSGVADDVVALVPDPTLSALVGDLNEAAAAPALAVQRFHAELAMLTAERPSHGRDVLVAPPRRFDPDPALVRRLLTDATTAKWMAPASAARLPTAPLGPDRGPVDYPDEADQNELPSDWVETIARVQVEATDFATSVVDPDAAREMVDAYDRTLRMAASSSWRLQPEVGGSYLGAVESAINRTRAAVHIVKPSGSGVYSLASSDSPLFLTVANDLAQPVRVRLTFTSGTPGFAVTDIGEQVIDARSRTTLRIPAQVERSGEFVVDAQVTTPAGRPLGGGEPVRLQVRSTAFGTVALAITGAAFGLLLLLTVRRVIVRARRRGETEPETSDLSPHAEQALLAEVDAGAAPRSGG